MSAIQDSSKLISVLPDLGTFIIVAKEESFTAAAKKLNVTPSALSKMITRLESVLEVTLFYRTTRRLQITTVGLEILEQSQLMLSAAQQAVELANQNHATPHGALTIGAPESLLNFVIEPFVYAFLDSHPNIKIRLKAIEGQFDMLEEGIDIAFLLTDKPQDNLVLKVIRPTRLILCATPQYLSNRSIPTHPSHLTEHDCLFLSDSPKDRLWLFASDEEYLSIKVKGRYAVNQAQMRLNGVLNHFGIGIFHDYVAQEKLASGEIVQVLEDWEIKSNYHGNIIMQYPHQKFLPSKIRAFVDFINSSPLFS